MSNIDEDTKAPLCTSKLTRAARIERTQRNTVLALSNEIEYAVLFLAVEKRECVTRLRQRGESGTTLYLKLFAELDVGLGGKFLLRESGTTLYLKLFAAALFLLLEDHVDQLDEIVIDPEYPGKERQIRELLLNHIWKVSPPFPQERIVFEQIGKKSPAHRKALAVYRGKDRANRKIRARDILRLLK